MWVRAVAPDSRYGCPFWSFRPSPWAQQSEWYVDGGPIRCRSLDISFCDSCFLTLLHCLLSRLCLWIIVEQKKSRGDSDSNAKWAVTCSAITFAVTGLVVLMHMSPVLSSFIVNTRIEGVLCLLLAAFWAATVSVVSNASTGLAVNSELSNTIVNGNLYYFSWAGFVTSIMLCVAYLRGVFGVDLAGEMKNRAARLTLWSGLLACQLVVMGASANVFDKDCAFQDTTSPYCKRTKYGISLGAIGTFFALAVVGMKMVTAVAPFVVEGILAIVLCIMNGFGVAFLTSANGPGAPIGNLYYFSWLSFLCNMVLVTSVYEDYRNLGVAPEKEGEDDVQVENMDDAI